MLETVDQNFIKTLLDNLPQNIEELSVPKDKNNKKTLELISLAEEKIYLSHLLQIKNYQLLSNYHK